MTMTPPLETRPVPHDALDLPPTPPSRARRDPPLRDLLELPDPRLVHAFRSALTRRGAAPRLVQRCHGGLFTCAPCFDAAIASLGLVAEPVAPRPDERGLLERYDRLAWYFTRPGAGDAERDDLDAEEAAGAADEEAGHAARFYADRRLGLFRIAAPGAPDADAIWLWTFEDGNGDQACVAAPSRARLRPLLTALRREDRDHERRSGLVLVGNHSDGHARRTRVGWDELTLAPALEQDLRATVREFFQAGALYRRHRLPHRRGLLLVGPPGNGKTSILRAIASDVDLPVVVATLDSPNDVHNTRQAFQRAAELAPAVVCFEDLDALVGEGPGLSQFLNLLDGLEPLEGVLVVATTNRPDRIDPAIAKRPSRFDRVFLIGEPDLDLRRRYLERSLGADAPPGAPERLAAATDGYSVAFLKELALQARLAAVRRGEERLTDEDLDGALAATREHLRLASRGLEERGLGFVKEEA